MSGLPWIKLYGNVPEHPKSDMLEAELGVERAWTHVVELWLWVSKVRPDGVLAGMSDGVIAKRSGWTGDASAFVAALISTGWMTEERELVGWDEHQGAHKRKVERDRERRKAKPETAEPNASAEPARHPSGTRATPEGESEREIEREKEIPPTGGVGGEPHERKRSRRKRKPQPPKPNRLAATKLYPDFVEARTGSRPDTRDGVPRAFVDAFERYLDDGGEPETARRLAVAAGRSYADWSGPVNWSGVVDRGLASLHAPQQTSDASRARSGPPAEDLHGNRIVLAPGYVWDEHDARFLAEGRAWLGPDVRPHWSEPREIRA